MKKIKRILCLTALLFVSLAVHSQVQEENDLQEIIKKQEKTPENSWREMIRIVMNTNPTYSPENDKYKGFVYKNNLGAYLWNNGNFYIGGWNNSSMSGNGIFMTSDRYEIINCSGCKYYVGNQLKEKKSGSGRCYDKTGKLIYDGEFSDNKPTDTYPSTNPDSSYKFEFLEYADGIYAGETTNGMNHGYGIYLYTKGDIIGYGAWEAGGRKGKGGFIYKDGSFTDHNWEGDSHKWRNMITHTALSSILYIAQSSYQGRRNVYLHASLEMWMFDIYVNWKLASYGITIYDDGHTEYNCSGCTSYVGNKKNDLKHGYGRCYDKDGNLIYQGKFSKGKPKETYPSRLSGSPYKFETVEYNDGSVYVGETNDGQSHGQGIYLYTNGDVWYGQFEAGHRKGEGFLIEKSNNHVREGYWNGDVYSAPKK